MSWSKRGKDFVHPYTFFLVNDGLSAVFTCIKEGSYVDAVRFLYFLVSFLDKDAQKKLNDVCKRVRKVMLDTSLLTDEEFWDIQTTIMTNLHEQGYFLTAKVAPTSKPTKAKDFGAKMRKGLQQ